MTPGEFLKRYLEESERQAMMTFKNNPLFEIANNNRDYIQNKMRLTPRQTDIVIQLTKGITHLNVAELLGISEKTVKFHIKRICVINGVTNKTKLIIMVSNIIIYFLAKRTPNYGHKQILGDSSNIKPSEI